MVRILWWSYISCANLTICIRISFSSFKFLNFFFLSQKLLRWKPLILFANQNIIFLFFITQKSLFILIHFFIRNDTAFVLLFPFSQKICLHLTASFVYAHSPILPIIYVPSLCFSSSHHRNIVNHFDYCWFLNKFEWNFSYCWLECFVLY